METTDDQRGAKDDGVVELPPVNASLNRTLGLFDGISVIAGIIIGTGIFASPGVVVGYVNQIGVALLVWVLGGILSLLGGLCFAELGAALPSTGGEYVYLKALNPLLAFLFVWAAFLCVKTGSLAIISIVFARYFGAVILQLDVTDPNIDDDYRIKCIAILGIALVACINILSIKLSSKVQQIFFFCKFLAIGIVCIMGVYSVIFGDTREVAIHNLESLIALPTGFSFSLRFFLDYMLKIGVATVAGLWAYDGFTNLNHIAEEIKNPQKNIPQSIVIAISIVLLAYLSINMAYFLVLTKEQVIESRAIAVSIAQMVWGKYPAMLTALLVAASAFGSLNGSIMTGSRTFYAGAKDGLIPFAKILSATSTDFQTPYAGILLDGGVAVVIIILGDFNTLVNYFGFTAWIFYGLCAVSLIHIRRNRPDVNLPFKVRPYPFIPVLFIICSAAVIASAIIEDPIPTFISLFLVGLGIPAYYLFFWRGNLIARMVKLLDEQQIENVPTELKAVAEADQQ